MIIYFLFKVLVGTTQIWALFLKRRARARSIFITCVDSFFTLPKGFEGGAKG